MSCPVSQAERRLSGVLRWVTSFLTPLVRSRRPIFLAIAGVCVPTLFILHIFQSRSWLDVNSMQLADHVLKQVFKPAAAIHMVDTTTPTSSPIPGLNHLGCTSKAITQAAVFPIFGIIGLVVSFLPSNKFWRIAGVAIMIWSLVQGYHDMVIACGW